MRQLHAAQFYWAISSEQASNSSSDLGNLFVLTVRLPNGGSDGCSPITAAISLQAKPGSPHSLERETRGSERPEQRTTTTGSG